MAFDWGTGFELNSLSVEIGAISGSPTVQTTVKRSGAYAMKTSSMSSGAAQGVRTGVTAGAGPFFFQFCLCLETLPGINNRIIIWNDNDAFTTPLFWIRLNTDGTLTFADEDGTIGSASSALTADGSTFYFIEVKYDRSPAAGSHVLEAKLNGTSFASSSSRNLSANVAFWGWGGNLETEANTTGVWYWDDLVFNTSAGSYMNDYPGGVKIIHLKPDGAGDNSAWTGSYTDIDEVTPDDGTTFISEGPSADTIDVTLEATPSEVTSGSTIKGVFVGHRANLSSATGSDPRYVLRLKASSGGTTDESGAQLPNTTTWYTNAPSSKSYITGNGTTLAVGNSSNYEQPGGSSAWTKSALDTAQIGARITVTDTDNVQISAMWLLVLFLVSGNQYTQDVSGGITPAGEIFKDGRKILQGGNTPSGSLNKSISKTLAGSISSLVGTLAKSTNKILGGGISSIVGTLTASHLFSIILSGDLTSSGTLSRSTSKILGSIITPAGEVNKFTTKSFAGTLSLIVGTLNKQSNKTFSGDLSSFGDIFKTSQLPFAGSIAPTGSIFKIPNKSLQGSVTSSGSLSKAISKFFSGTLTSAGELFKRIPQSLAGTLTSSGTLLKQAQKTLAGSLSSSGSLSKSISKILGGVVTFSGDLLKQAQKILSGILTSAGSLVADYIPAGGVNYFQSVGGTLTSAGSILKSTTKSFIGSITPSGLLSKLTSKTFAGTLTQSGSISKEPRKSLAGSLASSGSLSKLVAKLLGGTLTQAGSVSKEIRKSLSGLLTSSGSLLSGAVFVKALDGALTFAGQVTKSTLKILSGNITSSGSLSKAFSKLLSGTLTLAGNVNKSISIQLSGILGSSGILGRILNPILATISKVHLIGSHILSVQLKAFHRPIARLLGTSKRLEGEERDVIRFSGDNK